MPNIKETVRALISAFNVHNYARNTVKTNFTLQTEGKKDYIVVSFEKSMNTYQCRRYLNSIKRKIIREFYGIEESNDAEILDTAKLIFDVNSFPFNISDRDWFWDEQNGYKFVTPIDQGVIFNLKSHLASSLKKDILEDMQISSTTVPFNKRKYLCCSKFDTKESRQQFERGFLSRMGERYENVPKKPLKVEGNSVYIKDVFDDARFIDSVTQRVAWLVGRDLQADSKSRSDVRAFKDLIMEILDPSTRVVTSAFLCASPLNREEASILIPVILSNRGTRFLTKEEARDINHKFNNPVLDDISDKTQATFKVNGSGGIYGIDFSNPYISHCVITKIIESSVINKDHELSIDPELHFRALLPVQSPFNSPTHAGPSGLRTPPKQRRSIDSGIGESPPKPKDSGSSSGDPGPSTELSDMEWESSIHFQNGRLPNGYLDEAQLTRLRSPTGKSQDGALEGFPRQVLHNVGAVKNVPAGPSAWSQPIGFWSSPTPSAEPSLWPQSRPLSRKGANESGSAWTSQPIGYWSSQSTSSGFSDSLWTQSEPSSWKGADESMRTGKSTWYVSSSGVEDVNNVEHEKQQVSGECSEAKSQESESPKKRRSGFSSKISAFFSPSKSKHDASLNRCDVGRDTTRSVPVISVTEKPPVSKRFFSFPSRVRAENNSPSKETSPVTEACTKNKPGATELEDGGFSNKPKIRALTSVYPTKLQESLNPDQREELLKEWEIKKSSVKAQLPGERSSQASADSGLGKSLERGQSPSLIEEFNDKSLINSRVDSPDIKKHLQEEKEVFV